MKKVEEHYDINYFEKYQKKMGEFGGIANQFMFKDYINKTDTVLDFGCGGGFLLQKIICRIKYGVELNDIARTFCNKIVIKCFKNIDEIEDNSIDVVISCHCLEHTLTPYHIIEKIYKKLKNGGRVVLVVPLDSYKYKWKPHDVNYHLYSFSPMNLGNLLDACGFKNIKSECILHKWPPFYYSIQKYFGWTFFHFMSRIYGKVNTHSVQVRSIGYKI